MPHQCVRCNKFYEDGSTEIIQGCSCGAKLFFFIKKEKLAKLKEVQTHLTRLSTKEKEQIQEDVFTLVGKNEEEDDPIILDFESINVKKPGKFELDLVNLFNRKNPLIFKLEEGKYVIDLPKSFRTGMLDDL